MYLRLASALVLLLCSGGITRAEDTSKSDQDLAIGFDRKTRRPNVFIAWRNTLRILEVEVEVKNYGNAQAKGELSMAVLDETGQVLAQSPRSGEAVQIVEIPPSGGGGKEGTIVQMKGSKELNLLIDRLDRNRERYHLKAEVRTIGHDVEPLNNTVVKSFNVGAKVRPGCSHFYDYYFKNPTGKPVEVRWSVAASELPEGWLVESHPKEGELVTMAPDEIVQGVAIVRVPTVVQEGARLDLQFAVQDKSEGTKLAQTEWFLVHDNKEPEISGLSYSVDDKTGAIRVTLTAHDTTSMIKEASGVRVDYSTDGGVTFSSKVMAYLDGNFVGATRFGTDLGPFFDRTQIAMHLIVDDIAGNSAKRTFDPITVNIGRTSTPLE